MTCPTADRLRRVVVWFSAGVTSAIAAKLAVEKYRGILPVHLVNTDTGSEDEDNFRFMQDVSEWIGVSIEIIRNEKYKDTFDVYERTGFFKNQYGAKCTVELKKVPRRKYEDLEGDLQVFGFDADESDRAYKFSVNNPEVRPWFPLIEAHINKATARQMLVMAGIKEPRTYSEGFKNANCLRRGCVKGGIGYWNHIRKVRPEVFSAMAREERKIGYALLSRGGLPVYLDELPDNIGNYNAEPSFQCSLFCWADDVPNS